TSGGPATTLYKSPAAEALIADALMHWECWTKEAGAAGCWT
ncbi:unnamed protein product, partial [Tilletia laevis]